MRPFVRHCAGADHDDSPATAASFVTASGAPVRPGAARAREIVVELGAPADDVPNRSDHDP